MKAMLHNFEHDSSSALGLKGTAHGLMLSNDRDDDVAALTIQVLFFDASPSIHFVKAYVDGVRRLRVGICRFWGTKEACIGSGRLGHVNGHYSVEFSYICESSCHLQRLNSFALALTSPSTLTTLISGAEDMCDCIPWWNENEENEQKERSEAIDRQIEEDSKRLRRECKILLLGSGESGKSTIVKQMHIIHKGGYSEEERMTFREAIYNNILDSAQAILVAIEKTGLIYPDQAVAEQITKYRIDNSTGFVLSPEITLTITGFWQEPFVATFLDHHASEFYLMDNAYYFLSEVARFGSPDYIPNETDILRARKKTTGISETRFSMGLLQIHLFDVGGQRSERRKWIHYFESVTSIIFCTAMSEYDQVLLEEASQVPLERYFPEYTGGNDINKAAKFILWKYMQTNRARLSVYPHLTQATDTTNIRLVFATVKETILQNALKDSKILK
ncbi:hypothetical protein D9758_009305 [Tetrapyrgos nigripes]|uniref:Guanine nucleotide-binding protein subunit alpha n=1 Tax=Tetrapyrgos nigripes TaxID=182062 RepID=A0A8H5GGX7_9AGAR|nr:hypothetical protein D9758_009305 [Tetrapyrgos nigripes]